MLRKHTGSRSTRHAIKFVTTSVGRPLLEAVQQRASPDKDIYEFGVYTGGHMREFAKKIRGFGHLWGFDSFTGFPDETTDSSTGKSLWVYNNHWQAGGNSASDRLGVWNMTALFQYLHKRINYTDTTFIQGYYNVSLTPQLLSKHRFRPAVLVDLDCDMHISTMQAMRWLLTSQILVKGTLVRYDDWPRLHDPDGKPWGQRLAHIEITRDFGLRWKVVVSPIVKPYYAVVYELLEVGAATPDAAIVDADRPSATWCLYSKQNSKDCVKDNNNKAKAQLGAKRRKTLA